jgi:hypothetical protein
MGLEIMGRRVRRVELERRDFEDAVEESESSGKINLASKSRVWSVRISHPVFGPFISSFRSHHSILLSEPAPR